ncbi:hypothetical protein B9Z55_012752 [Caenorhabditis nigoni]|uniref:F-box domain-containing protein n=1 Tax=Caenorhabditis nigoni TaxID=1611254 RepID=A0A2G5TYM8_9PELO|nr:hypothetical protein B9Z55_012752 [Caenorhabditis nigoni]
MASTIENLAKMTENLSIEPVYNTNWCDMPEELKRECIGKMGFDERLALRFTAKTERSLVNSENFMFHDGGFYMHGNHDYIPASWCIYLTLDKENQTKKNYKNTNDGERVKSDFEFIKFIWGVGVFETFSISCDLSFMEELNYTGKITAKNVVIAEWCRID